MTVQGRSALTRVIKFLQEDALKIKNTMTTPQMIFI